MVIYLVLSEVTKYWLRSKIRYGDEWKQENLKMVLNTEFAVIYRLVLNHHNAKNRIMVTPEFFRQLALSFPGAEEHPHFDIPSFRYKNKIFATFWVKDNKAMLRLPLVEQSVFCAHKDSVFYPVPGFWGTKGATFVELSKVRKDMFRDALTIAYKFIKEGK